ncbi:MAG: DUF364 domain-containing protein [Sedimenticolaceae bacterium]
MIPIDEEYQQIGTQLAARLGHPAVTGLYLPAPVADETFRDEFGFVLLADGSVGPFYVSMGDLLRELWLRHPEPELVRGDPATLLRGFADGDLAKRALALGTFNALSAALFHKVGFVPPERAGNAGLNDFPAGGSVGMVGYFRPLVDKLTAQGCSVRVLELSPERVEDKEGVSCCGDPSELIGCDLVLCSASALINGSIEGLLAVFAGRVRIEMIGPSGSGLPDPLFARGVSAVGGSLFSSQAKLIEHLRRGEPWGSVAHKYQLDAVAYPGLTRLLDELADRHPDTGQA